MPGFPEGTGGTGTRRSGVPGPHSPPGVSGSERQLVSGKERRPRPHRATSRGHGEGGARGGRGRACGPHAVAGRSRRNRKAGGRSAAVRPGTQRPRAPRASPALRARRHAQRTRRRLCAAAQTRPGAPALPPAPPEAAGSRAGSGEEQPPAGCVAKGGGGDTQETSGHSRSNNYGRRRRPQGSGHEREAPRLGAGWRCACLTPGVPARACSVHRQGPARLPGGL